MIGKLASPKSAKLEMSPVVSSASSRPELAAWRMSAKLFLYSISSLRYSTPAATPTAPAGMLKRLPLTEAPTLNSLPLMSCISPMTLLARM